MRPAIARAIQRLRAARLPSQRQRRPLPATWTTWVVEYRKFGMSIEAWAEALVDSYREGIVGWMWHHDPIRDAWPIVWEARPTPAPRDRQRPPRRTVRRMKKARRR